MSEWQIALRHAINDPDELLTVLQLQPYKDLGAALASFPLRVPRAFVARMQVGNPADPLLLQVLPQAQEMQEQLGYVVDPLQETQFNPVPGLLHKYRNRVLLTLAGSCAVNCRYCFRRHFPYQDNVGWRQAVDYIAAHLEIDEVILSGGDPLVAKDALLAEVVAALERVAHVKRLRIHTRLPIVIPARVTDALVALLDETRLQVVVVIHCNHPNELDTLTVAALQRFRGVTLLNQSVLLRGVNDHAETLRQLSEALFAAKVLPYYLHVLDPVAGAAHFEVAESLRIYRALQASTSGYLLPKLVREVPGKPAKTILV